jgi:hypothetical protein
MLMSCAVAEFALRGGIPRYGGPSHGLRVKSPGSREQSTTRQQLVADSKRVTTMRFELVGDCEHRVQTR